MIASFERFEIRIAKDDALYASHPGNCDQEVSEMAEKYRRRLDRIPADSIRAELAEYGAWSPEELADDAQNRLRIIWIACGNIREEMA